MNSGNEIHFEQVSERKQIVPIDIRIVSEDPMFSCLPARFRSPKVQQALGLLEFEF
jgi:hypothetical protein